MRERILHGDCLDVLATLDADSIDACCTDPPYGLEFMGKEWDKLGDVRKANRGSLDNMRNANGAQKFKTRAPAFDLSLSSARAMQEWHECWAREVFRVLKPGAHLLAFGGSRTYHRLACAIEDAGFEIRDTLAWMYGQGFPKSLNLRGEWQGWGTALKPAFEPIVLARKPLTGTVAENVQAHGTGALNVDGCRIAPSTEYGRSAANARGTVNAHEGFDGKAFAIRERDAEYASPLGRWPANVLLDEEAARMLDEQSGESGERPRTFQRNGERASDGWGLAQTQTATVHADHGGASRFFYTSKANRREREGSKHPTVKPLDLMRWLVRLVCPPGGTVLDPFAGTGTTGEAALMEGFSCVLIEREAEYVADIEKRLRETQLGMGL